MISEDSGWYQPLNTSEGLLLQQLLLQRGFHEMGNFQKNVVISHSQNLSIFPQFLFDSSFQRALCKLLKNDSCSQGDPTEEAKRPLAYASYNCKIGSLGSFMESTGFELGPTESQPLTVSTRLL